MMRIRYAVQTHGQSAGLVSIKFSTGMEIPATREELDRIADALDAAALGASREIRSPANWSLKVQLINRIVHLDWRASTTARSVGLLPQVANALALELREVGAATTA